MDKEQPPIQVPLQNNSHETCIQIREATSQWNLAQNLGVTCATKRCNSGHKVNEDGGKG